MAILISLLCYLTIVCNCCIKSRIATFFDDRKDIFSDFFVDNEGNFVFTKGNKSNSPGILCRIFHLITKPAEADSFIFNTFDLAGKYLDEIKLKIDNVNQHYIINSLYYEKKRGNVEGIYTAVWDIHNQNIITQQFQIVGRFE